AVVDDREGIGVLLVDERHQVPSARRWSDSGSGFDLILGPSDPVSAARTGAYATRLSPDQSGSGTIFPSDAASQRRRSAMEPSSPAKVYATVVGAVLTILGLVGFFYSSSFGSPGSVDEVFGILSVNGWHNVLHLATGLLGLAAAGYFARTYALALGLAYLVVAIWGFAIGSGEAIL